MSDMQAILMEIGQDERKILAFEKHRHGFVAQKEILQAKIRELDDSIDNLKKEKLETQKALDSLNLSVSEHDLKLKDLDGKRTYILSGGGKNADLDVVKKQIEEEKADRSVIEDECLQLWEKVEKVAADLVKSTAEVAAVKQEINQKTAAVDKEIAAVDKEIAAATAVIKGHLDTLSTTDLDAFSFFQRLHGKAVRPAVVSIVHDTCQGCYLALPPDVRNKVYEGDSLVKCPNCYRILYAGDAGGQEEDGAGA